MNLLVDLLVYFFVNFFVYQVFLILYEDILQNLLITPKVYQIIQLALSHQDHLLHLKLAKSFTTFYRSIFILLDEWIKTIQYHLLLLLLFSNIRLKLKFIIEKLSFAISSQLYFLLLLQLQVIQQILYNNQARFQTKVCLYSIVIYYYNFNRPFIYQKSKT